LKTPNCETYSSDKDALEDAEINESGLVEADKVETPVRTMLGIEVKKNTTCLNFSSILLIQMGQSLGSMFLNYQVIFLLMSPHYFDIKANTDKSEVDSVTTHVNQINSRLVIYATICQCFMSIFIGQFYDIFGRRSLILICFVAMAVGLGMLPYTSPSIFALGLVRCLTAIFS